MEYIKADQPYDHYGDGEMEVCLKIDRGEAVKPYYETRQVRQDNEDCVQQDYGTQY
jgi:hypothetical protein